ncbi:MAG: hypothetical protein GY790_03200 [Bacteroidetes bacterium]|nr:hypothetical protein [Bacteroidota bacterium]
MKQMKTLRLFTFLLITALALTSCDWHSTRTVIGSGDVESEEIEASGFSGVTVTGSCEVDITIGESYSVELHAQPQVLEVMTCKVVNGILNIGFHPDYNVNSSKDISATITLPALNYVSITGEGDFVISGAKQAQLDIHITGAGDVNAFDMEVDQCNIYITGAGNCEVNVESSLDVQISGVGNVYYIGNPRLTSDISGVGNISAVGR